MKSDEDRSLAAAEHRDFWRDGYVIVRQLLAKDETDALNVTINSDAAVRQAVYGLADSGGSTTELALWSDLGEDIFGALARNRRVVDRMGRLLGGEVAFFHSKLTLKRPRIGGAWDWHQDYGYWYHSGFLFPDMASVFVAVDPATRQNGCLQVLKGSHRIGRIDHGVVGGQKGADMIRVEAASQRCDLVYVELDPGDALFFHSLTLHASGRNDSDHSRNVFLACYNRADNPPVLKGANIAHVSIDPLADERLIDYAGRPLDTKRQAYRPEAAAPLAPAGR